ncbi:DinB family protein [Tenacibaculum sp. 190524A02b]|uniref:DinB family protein n=1 Tax=Tenacibaculum vairaonense TaxID=3137860 RepID=UPI0031FB4B29
MTQQELTSAEFDSYYQRYIDKVDAKTSLINGFIEGKTNVIRFFNTIPRDKLLFKYKIDKWTIKEVFQHIIDTERIFMHRCFRIARRDTTSLSGFDQNIYIIPSRANEKSIESLLEEFTLNREHSINLLKSFTDEDLKFIGNSNGGKMSARAAAYTIIGHDLWHMEVIKDKYLTC